MSRRVFRSGLTAVLVLMLVNCSGPMRSMSFVDKRVSDVSTFAGVPGGSGGLLVGPAATAQFYIPAQAAFGPDGSMYIADWSHYILRISGGSVSVWAGTGVASSNPSNPTNGPRLTADFSSPQGLAFDGSGNLYVSDNGNQCIRKISPDGTVSTLAGSGFAGFHDGLKTAASFYYPSNLAVDGQGNVYVNDLYNHAVRKVTPNGYVTTLAGSGGGTDNGGSVQSGYANGTGAAALFTYPAGIAAAADGTVYVTDQNNVVRQISPDGTVSTLAGYAPEVTSGSASPASHTDGRAITATFNQPYGIVARSSGAIYVVDCGNYVVRKILNGYVSTVACRPGVQGFTNGQGLSATFTLPMNITQDREGNLFVVETNDPINAPFRFDNTIRKLTFEPAF